MKDFEGIDIGEVECCSRNKTESSAGSSGCLKEKDSFNAIGHKDKIEADLIPRSRKGMILR